MINYIVATLWLLAGLDIIPVQVDTLHAVCIGVAGVLYSIEGLRL